MDESHLFIAQFPQPASTVWSAHQILRGAAVRLAERSAFEPTLREGEWFLVSLLPRPASVGRADPPEPAAPRAIRLRT